jgi:hypothetical protein
LRSRTGACLYCDLVAELRNLLDRLRRRGDAPLSGVNFLWNTDLHVVLVSDVKG